MGNSTSPVNYMAAVPMSEFAAKKIFALVQQLNQAGIKIEIIAHSLGCAVLAKTLSLCAEASIKVTHAHLWQPAIPDNALNQKVDYLPILIPNDENKEINFPCNYDYQNAHEGAEAITVLFSDQDSVLGQVVGSAENPNAKFNFMTRLQQAFVKAYAPCLYQKQKTNNEIWETIKDPGAGWKMAITAAVVEAMDSSVIPLAKIHQKMISIYHLANLYRYPMDYIFEGTEEDLVTYYNDWKNQFVTMQATDPKTNKVIEIPLKETIYEQSIFLQNKYPSLKTLIISILDVYYSFQNSNVFLSEIESDEYQKVLGKLLVEINYETLLVNLNWKANYHVNGKTSKQKILVTTIILTCLITNASVPRGALGYSPQETNAELFVGNNVFEINQKEILIDHNAMLFPDSNFIAQIYKGKLFNGTLEEKIKYFGKWRSD